MVDFGSSQPSCTPHKKDELQKVIKHKAIPAEETTANHSDQKLPVYSLGKCLVARTSSFLFFKPTFTHFAPLLAQGQTEDITNKLVSKNPWRGLKQELHTNLSVDCKADLLLPIILMTDLL